MLSGTEGDRLEHNLVVDHAAQGCLVGAFRSARPMVGTAVRSNVVVRSGTYGIEIRPHQHTVEVAIESNWLVDVFSDGINVRGGQAVTAKIIRNAIVHPRGAPIRDDSAAGSTVTALDNDLRP